jgi:hypothetical protein
VLKEVILDSYNGAKVKKVTSNLAINSINIERGVKQCGPLSSILFDIGIDHLIER